MKRARVRAKRRVTSGFHNVQRSAELRTTSTRAHFPASIGATNEEANQRTVVWYGTTERKTMAAMKGTFGKLIQLLSQESTAAAHRFMKKGLVGGQHGWMKASLGEVAKEKTETAVHLVCMAFMPDARKKGEEPVAPSRHVFMLTMMAAFDITEFDGRKQVHAKDLICNAALLVQRLQQQQQRSLGKEGTLHQPDEVLSSIGNVDAAATSTATSTTSNTTRTPFIQTIQKLEHELGVLQEKLESTEASKDKQIASDAKLLATKDLQIASDAHLLATKDSKLQRLHVALLEAEASSGSDGALQREIEIKNGELQNLQAAVAQLQSSNNAKARQIKSDAKLIASQDREIATKDTQLQRLGDGTLQGELATKDAQLQRVQETLQGLGLTDIGEIGQLLHDLHDTRRRSGDHRGVNMFELAFQFENDQIWTVLHQSGINSNNAGGLAHELTVLDLPARLEERQEMEARVETAELGMEDQAAFIAQLQREKADITRDRTTVLLENERLSNANMTLSTENQQQRVALARSQTALARSQEALAHFQPVVCPRTWISATTTMTSRNFYPLVRSFCGSFSNSFSSKILRIHSAPLHAIKSSPFFGQS